MKTLMWQDTVSFTSIVMIKVNILKSFIFEYIKNVFLFVI